MGVLNFLDSLVKKTSPLGQLIHGDPAGDINGPEYAQYNENQRQLLHDARLSDAKAVDRGGDPGSEAQLLNAWLKQDKDTAQYAARGWAEGRVITPEQAAAAARAGRAFDPEMLNADQQALATPMTAADRYKKLRQVAPYLDSVSDLTGLEQAAAPEYRKESDGYYHDVRNPQAGRVGEQIPDLEPGQQIMPDGSIGWMPGVVAAKAQMEGTVRGAGANAQEQAETRYAEQKAAATGRGQATTQLTEVWDDASNTYRSVPVSQVLAAGGMPSKQSPHAAALDTALTGVMTKDLEGGQARVEASRGLVRPMEEVFRMSGQVDTNKLKDIAFPLRQYASALGWTNDPTLGDAEALRSAMKYIVPRMRVEGSGSTSNFDAAMYEMAAPNFANTSFANRVNAGLWLQNQKRDERIQSAKMAWARKNGNLDNFDADREVGLLIERPTTPEAQAKLAPGTVFIDMEGHTAIKE